MGAPTSRVAAPWGSTRSGCRPRRRRAAGPVRAGRHRPPGRRPRGSPDRCRRRHGVRRCRGLRGGGARLLDRGRHRLPARAHGRRPERRRGVRPAGVPLQRLRRPVHDHRGAAGRPPAVGQGRRGQRGRTRAARPAAARRHLVGHDDEARPVGQHAADDGRLLRRGRGRRRRRDRAALRRGTRPARRLLPAHRAQHPEPAGRGGAPGPRARPGRRLLVRRVPHRPARAGGLGLVHRDRAGRRPGRGPGLGPGAATGSPPRGTPAPSGSPRARTPSPASASSPTSPRSCPTANPRRRSCPPAGCPGCGRRRASRSCATGRRRRTGRPRVYLATIGPVARHTARAGFAGNLFQAGGLETPSGDGVDGFRRRGDDGRLHLRHRQGLRGLGGRRWPPS